MPIRSPKKRRDGVSSISINEMESYPSEEERRRTKTTRGRTQRKNKDVEREVKKRKEQEEELLSKKGRKRKRKRKTTGQLLAEGRVSSANKRLSKTSTALIETGDVVDLPVEGYLIPSMDFTSEREFMEEYEHIRATQSAIVRKLEEKLMDKDSKISNRDVYALSTMYSQYRETMADMRSIKDMNAQAEILATEVFEPAAKASGEALIRIYHFLVVTLRQHIKDRSVIEVILDKLKQEMGTEATELQEQLMLSKAKILESLSNA